MLDYMPLQGWDAAGQVQYTSPHLCVQIIKTLRSLALPFFHLQASMLDNRPLQKAGAAGQEHSQVLDHWHEPSMRTMCAKAPCTFLNCTRRPPCWTTSPSRNGMWRRCRTGALPLACWGKTWTSHGRSCGKTGGVHN